MQHPSPAQSAASVAGPVIPSFSVVIPTYNRADLLPRAVESVLRQSWRDFEVLVVDDGSTDGTEQLVRGWSDPRIRYVRKENGGVGSARNLGAREARSEWLVFLDSDDEATPGWLSLAREATATGECDLFCGAVRIVKNGQIKRVKAPHRLGQLFGDLQASFLAGAFFVRRSLFLEVGGYREDLTFGENFELGLRISARLQAAGAARRVASTEEVLLVVHRHQGPRGSELSPQRLASIERFIALHGELLARHPGEHLRMHQLACVLCLRMGRYRDARRHALRCLRLAPFHWKTLPRLMLTLPGLRRANWYYRG